MYTFFTASDAGSIEDLRQAYLRQVIRLHPNRHEEDEALYWREQFLQMCAEYEISLKKLGAAAGSKTEENTLKEKIDAIVGFAGVEINIAGCWLWLSGDSYPYRHNLSLLGFRWSKKKKAWYWGLTMRKGGRVKAKHRNLDEIYEAYGRERIKA